MAGDAAQRIAMGDEGSTGARLRTAILALAERRGPDSSICPSDAARAVGGARWRDLNAESRNIAMDLARAGAVEIAQRGDAVDPDSSPRGPIRIRIRYGRRGEV